MTKKLVTLILILIPLIVNSQIESDKLIGEYHSVNNVFEKWSILKLEENNNFCYEYTLGGCTGDIYGKWNIINNELHLINNEEYIIENINLKDSIWINDSTFVLMGKSYYPDLSKTVWKIGKKWIKPKSIIDVGCFKENGKHKKL